MLRSERIKRFLDSMVVTRAVQIIAVLSLVLAAVIGVQQIQFTRCIARYADDYNTAAQARAKAAGETNDAVDKFIRAVVASTAAGTPAARQAAFVRAYETYLTSRAEADKLRADHALPEPPRETC